MHVHRSCHDAMGSIPSRKGMVKDGPWDGAQAFHARERPVTA